MATDLLNKYYTVPRKYAFIKIIGNRLVFHLSNIDNLEEAIFDIKYNFGSSIFQNIDVEITSYPENILVSIKKDGVLNQNCTVVLNDSPIMNKADSSIKKNKDGKSISIEQAKLLFANVGNESVYMIIDEVHVPVVFDGLVVNMPAGWENNIGKFHPDAISAKLYSDAIEQFDNAFEPRIKN